MTRHRSWMGLAALLVAGAIHGSAQSDRPSFDVASVRKQAAFLPPSPPTERPAPAGTTPVAAAFTRSNATVASLIRFAYSVRDAEILEGPRWIRGDLFEINARAADAVPVDQMRLMVQSLLEDRFKLVVRRELREMRGSALVVARSDRRLGRGLEKCEDPRAPLPPSAPVRVPYNAYPFSARCAPMSVLANAASGVMNVPVVDRTGLDGLWSYSFFYASPEPLPPGPARDRADAENTPQFAAALQEHLGLRLESTNGPFDVLVIESVEQPGEN